MATHDYVIENDVGANFRADINNALQAIVSQNSDTVEPTTTFPHMVWADATADILKVRSADNLSWVSVYTLSTGVPISGGGGGSLPINFPFDYTTRPTTYQLGTPLLPVNGSTYSRGDIIVTWNGNGSASNYTYELNIVFCLKDFTWSDVFGHIGHASRGDFATLRDSESTGQWSNSIDSLQPVTLTSVSAKIIGPSVYITDMTVGVNAVCNIGSEAYTSGVSKGVPWRSAMATIPWAIQDLAEANPDFVGYIGNEGYTFTQFRPVMPSRMDNSYDVHSKITFRWASATCIQLGLQTLPQTSFSREFQAVGYNGCVITGVGDLTPLIPVAPLDGETIYCNPSFTANLEGPGFLVGGAATPLLNTPVDGNTLAIGTYNTANGGTLTVGIA